MTEIIGHIQRVGRRPAALEDGLSSETRMILEAYMGPFMDIMALATRAQRIIGKVLLGGGTVADLREFGRCASELVISIATLLRDTQALLGVRVDGRQRVLPLGGPTPKAA